VSAGGTGPEASGAGTGPAEGGAADLDHLVHRRDLSVPDEDRVPLLEYWTHIRQLRGAVDERLLADSEIAVTWTAVATRDAE
jgi:hypothetical protein